MPGQAPALFPSDSTCVEARAQHDEPFCRCGHLEVEHGAARLQRVCYRLVTLVDREPSETCLYKASFDLGLLGVIVSQPLPLQVVGRRVELAPVLLLVSVGIFVGKPRQPAPEPLRHRVR